MTCAWLNAPALAAYLTLFIVSFGFASGLLAVFDWQRPFSQQITRLLAAFASWAVIGAGSLRLFQFLV